MVVLSDECHTNLEDLSRMLNCINIDTLHIYSIHSQGLKDNVDIKRIESPMKVNYIDLGVESFIRLLNSPNTDFLDYNKNSLYVLRKGNYIDVKNVLTKIQGYEVSVGRGGSQKAHMVSPLDFRLSCYLMAMFNLDFKLINKLNTFNFIDKSRYLPYIDRKNNTNKPIIKSNTSIKTHIPKPKESIYSVFSYRYKK
jgi:hypothetical protein